MRHIYGIERADSVGDLAHPGKVDNARIGAAATNNQLRSFFFGELFKIVIVNCFGLFGDTIRDYAVCLARKVQVMSVRKMSTVGKVKTQNFVSWLNDGSIGRHIRL